LRFGEGRHHRGLSSGQILVKFEGRKPAEDLITTEGKQANVNELHIKGDGGVRPGSNGENVGLPQSRVLPAAVVKVRANDEEAPIGEVLGNISQEVKVEPTS
jgi:hypothetical protein